MLPDKCKTAGCYNPGWCRDGRCGHHTIQVREHASYHYSPLPKSDDPHLGAELEFICPNRPTFRQVRAMKRNVCYDGSVGGLGGEMKILGIPPKVFAPAMHAASQLSERGALATRECGFHVHLDRRGVLNSRIAEFREWAKNSIQQWLFSLMPPSRRSNVYCTPITHGINYSRYEWLSATPKKTLEVRLHGGTLHPYKIQGWLAVCHDLMGLLRSGDSLPVVAYNTSTRRPENFANIFPSGLAQEYLIARQSANGQLTTIGSQEERDENV